MTKDKILQKIKKIEIASTLLANEVFSGNYRSYFKGNGMEFSNIRRYSPGDDIKKIDWKVSARQRKTYVKEFVEERELSIFLLIDISKSNDFIAKQDIISQLVGTIAFSAIKNGDKVGAVFFSDKIEKVIPLKKGKTQALIILDNYLSLKATGKGTNIGKALSLLNNITNHRAVVFLISDFIDTGYDKAINLTKLRHDLIPIKITDKKFSKLPKGAIFTMTDSETGEEIIIENFHKEYNFDESLSKDILNIYTDDNYIVKLSNFFKRRKQI